jgi:hypothetical protein
MFGRISKYVRIARKIFRVLEKAGVPRYFSRCSNRVYDVWQHLMLLAVRQLEDKPYRRFIEWLGDCKPLLRVLNVRRVPHYTTLQKFGSRIPSALLDRIIRGFTPDEPAPSTSLIVGVDALGFKPSKASSHYPQSLKPRRVKRYVKCTLAVDLRSQLVCGFKARRIARHDIVDFKPVLEKASLASGVIVVADKAYDAEHCHVYVREELGGYAVIPPRHKDVPVWKTKRSTGRN